MLADEESNKLLAHYECIASSHGIKKASADADLPMLPTSSILKLYQLYRHIAIKDPALVWALALTYRIMPYISQELSNMNATFEEMVAFILAHADKDENALINALSSKFTFNTISMKDTVADFFNDKKISDAILKTIITIIRDSKRNHYSDQNLQGKTCGPSAELLSIVGTEVSSFADHSLLANVMLHIPAAIMRANKAAVNIGIADSAQQFYDLQRAVYPKENEALLLPQNQSLDAGLTVAETRNLAYAEAGIISVNLLFNGFRMISNVPSSSLQTATAVSSALYQFVPIASATATSLIGVNLLLNLAHQIYAGIRFYRALSKEWERVQREDLNAFFLSELNKSDQTKITLQVIAKLRSQRGQIEKAIAESQHLILNRLRLDMLNQQLYFSLWQLAQRPEYAERLGYLSSVHYEFYMHAALSVTTTVTMLCTLGPSFINTLVFFGVISSAGAAPVILPIIASVAVGVTLGLLAYKFYRTYSRRQENDKICQQGIRFADLGLALFAKRHTESDDFNVQQLHYKSLAASDNLGLEQNADLWVRNTLLVIATSTALLSASVALGATLPFWAPAIPAAVVVVGAIYLMLRRYSQSPQIKEVKSLKQQVDKAPAKSTQCYQWQWQSLIGAKKSAPRPIGRKSTDDTTYGSMPPSPSGENSATACTLGRAFA